MLTDLYSKPLTQKNQIYEFIKSRGRAKTHEVINFGSANRINDAKERARDLKKEGKIWRMRKDLKEMFYPGCKEEIWSIYPADREIYTHPQTNLMR